MTTTAQAPQLVDAAYRYRLTDTFDWTAPALDQDGDTGREWTIRISEVTVTIGGRNEARHAVATLSGNWVRPDGTEAKRPRKHEMRFADGDTSGRTLSWAHAPVFLIHWVEQLRVLANCTRRDTAALPAPATFERDAR